MGFFDFLLRRQHHVQRLVGQYMDAWISGIRAFSDAWEVYVTDGQGGDFNYRVDATHKEESRADDMRRQIEHELYAKALLPESRGDILKIIEQVDHLLTEAETVLYDIRHQQLVIPEPLMPNFNKMVEVTISCCEMICKAVRVLFVGSGKEQDIVDLINEIDEYESKADHLERILIRNIFKMDIDTGEKLLYKNLVRQIANVTDGAEHVGDRITLVSVKRRV